MKKTCKGCKFSAVCLPSKPLDTAEKLRSMGIFENAPCGIWRIAKDGRSVQTEDEVMIYQQFVLPQPLEFINVNFSLPKMQDE